MKDQILLINDLAGYGKVALSAMLPVMTHAGLNLYNLPLHWSQTLSTMESSRY